MRNESSSYRFSLFALAAVFAACASLSTAPHPAFAKSKTESKSKAAPAQTEEAATDASKDKTDKKDKKGKNGKAEKSGDKGAAKPEQLGSYGDWGAYAAEGSKDKTCYALGQPKERQPKAKLKDTAAHIFISTRPGEGVRNEVAIDLGYATKDGSAASADIDGDGWELITKGNNAWIKDQSKEKEFVGALRGGSKLVVKASSAKGTSTTDTYSLKGLSDALARVAQECK